MKSLYCEECGEYLMTGSGDLVDCHCGWKQPLDEGIDSADYEALQVERDALVEALEAQEALAEPVAWMTTARVFGEGITTDKRQGEKWMKNYPSKTTPLYASHRKPEQPTT